MIKNSRNMMSMPGQDEIWTFAAEDASLGVTKVARERWPRGRRMSHQRRSNYAVLLLCSGSGSLSLGDGPTRAIGRGDLVLVAPDLPQLMVAESALQVWRVAWQGRESRSLLRRRLGCLSGVWSLRQPQLLEREHVAMMTYARAGHPLAAALCRQHLELLLLHLSRELLDRGESPAAHSLLVLQARTWMERHHLRRIGVAAAAAACGVTAAHLSRQFRAETGESPRDFLTRLRVQSATDLLLEDDRPLAVIAATLGYDDPLAFGKAFTRWSGRPPSSLRSGRS